MVSYKRILFPIDLTEKALKVFPHVEAIAAKFGAEVHLVYVAKTNEYYREDECAVGDTKCKPGKIITETVEKYVEENCSSLENIKVMVLSGEPEMELLAYIDKAEIDMVMMITKGKSALGKAVFGSVAGRMLRTSSVPLFFVRPE